MSLTREEWMQIWKELQYIDRYNNSTYLPSTKCLNINIALDKIKQKVQQAVGQLE